MVATEREIKDRSSKVVLLCCGLLFSSLFCVENCVIQSFHISGFPQTSGFLFARDRILQMVRLGYANGKIRLGNRTNY
jgi:hypothetical protein